MGAYRGVWQTFMVMGRGVKAVPSLGVRWALQAGSRRGASLASASQGWRVPALSQGLSPATATGSGGLQHAAEKREAQLLTGLVSLWEGLGPACSAGGRAQREEGLWARGPRPVSWLGGPALPTAAHRSASSRPAGGARGSERAAQIVAAPLPPAHPPALYKRKADTALSFRGVRSGRSGRLALRGAGPGSPLAALRSGGVRGGSLLPSGGGGLCRPGRGALFLQAGEAAAGRPVLGGEGREMPFPPQDGPRVLTGAPGRGKLVPAEEAVPPGGPVPP